MEQNYFTPIGMQEILSSQLLSVVMNLAVNTFKHILISFKTYWVKFLLFLHALTLRTQRTGQILCFSQYNLVLIQDDSLIRHIQ